MVAPTTTISDSNNKTTSSSRQRKKHTKSRAGCGNCKLRRVKCDESKPTCWKCDAYGVECDYSDNGKNASLQLSMGEEAFTLQYQPSAPPSTPPSERILGLLGMPLQLHESDEVYLLSEMDLQLLRKFEERTVRTVGTADTVETYKVHIVRLCGEHAVLTHVVLTLVLMHERALSANPHAAPSTKETFHWYHATGLVNGMLCRPVLEGEKDALWAAVALLSCATMGSIEATTPEEAWPLVAPSETDLDWLRMSTGKGEVWKITDPLREEGIWRPALMFVMEQRDKLVGRVTHPQFDALYPYLTKLCDIDESADSKGDPYHTARSILVRLLGVECNYSTIMYFLSWMGHMDPDYKNLLQQKDPQALMLLSWWYAKVWDYPAWWLQRRAQLECSSICTYLERNHGHDGELMRMLGYPRMVCGLGSTENVVA